MKYSYLLFVLFLSLIGNSQNNVKEKYRLSSNFAPHIIENTVVMFTNGTTKIFNESTQAYSKEVYTHFGTDNNSFWGLSDGNWCIGTCDSAIVVMKFTESKFDKIANLGLDYYLVWSGEIKEFLQVDLYNQTYKFVKSQPFESIECGEFERTVIVSKKISDGSIRFGCMSLETGKLIKDYLVDSVITCPRVFDEIALVKNDGRYHFYDFLANKKIGKDYISYKRVPIYRTVMGIYDNGVEIMDDSRIFNFDLGKVQNVEFENKGDFVYAQIKTDKGFFKIDLWEKKLVNE